MNRGTDLEEFQKVREALFCVVRNVVSPWEGGKGRTFDMLKKMGPSDTAIFHDRNSAFHGYVLAQAKGLELTQDQFEHFYPNRAELNRHIAGIDLSKKRYFFDHHWRELYWRSVIDEGYDVLESRMLGRAA